MDNSKINQKKIVLISGAAGGLGKALVEKFAVNGYKIIACDIKHDNPFEKLAGKNISYKYLDVTIPEQISAIRKELDLDQSGIDILICAAGIYDSYPVTEASPDFFQKMMAVNVHGTAALIQGMLAPMMKNKGHVVVISSESYKIQAMFQPYMISKSALEAYCRVARQELALKDVRLTLIRPGSINTPLLKWMHSPVDIGNYPVYNDELKKSLVRSVKMVGKIIPAEAVAKKIFMAAVSSHPKRVYRINNSILLNFVSLLPNSFFDWLMVRLFRIKK